MNKILRYIVTAVVICALSPVVASAHVLQSDGSIGAVLHINPDDDPHANVVTDYVLSFDDSDGKFSLAHCDCTVTFLENGTAIKQLPLVLSGDNESEDTFTFPKPDIYELQVSGKPKDGVNFQSFKLNYTLRVEGNQSSDQQLPLLLWIGLGMGIGLILLFAYASE